jgi:hypothetical protein
MLQTEITPWGRGADHLPLIQFCPGDLMTVLLLQGFEKITNEKLAQVLSNEKTEMLGEVRVPARKWAFNWLCVSSFADLVTKARKESGKKCYKAKS